MKMKSDTLGLQMACDQRIILVGLDAQAAVSYIGTALPPQKRSTAEIYADMVKCRKLLDHLDRVEEEFDEFQDNVLDKLAALAKKVQVSTKLRECVNRFQSEMIVLLDEMEDDLEKDMSEGHKKMLTLSMELTSP